jgi:integrase
LIHTRAPQAPLLDGCRGLAPRSLQKLMLAHLKAAGLYGQRDPRTGALRSISPPSLRHTAASLALEHWAELHQVQQMLRHASIQTTELYVHHKDRLRHAAAHRIPDLTRPADDPLRL